MFSKASSALFLTSIPLSSLSFIAINSWGGTKKQVLVIVFDKVPLFSGVVEAIAVVTSLMERQFRNLKTINFSRIERAHEKRSSR